MSSSKWLLITAVIASVAYVCYQPRHTMALETSGDDPNGFVTIADLAGAPPQRRDRWHGESESEVERSGRRVSTQSLALDGCV